VVDDVVGLTWPRAVGAGGLLGEDSVADAHPGGAAETMGRSARRSGPASDGARVDWAGLILGAPGDETGTWDGMRHWQASG
jgi:hypothetical protein